MYIYPVSLTHDTVTHSWMASCRDLPLMHSVGDSIENALSEAAFGLVTAIAIEVDERRPIPTGSAAQKDEYAVSVPVLVAMKAALHNAMIETGTRKAELARKLEQKPPQIDRLLDVEHSSRIETVELALRKLNRSVSLTITVS
jgi:antitoxin HicB